MKLTTKNEFLFFSTFDTYRTVPSRQPFLPPKSLSTASPRLPHTSHHTSQQTSPPRALPRTARLANHPSLASLVARLASLAHRRPMIRQAAARASLASLAHLRPMIHQAAARTAGVAANAANATAARVAVAVAVASLESRVTSLASRVTPAIAVASLASRAHNLDDEEDGGELITEV